MAVRCSSACMLFSSSSLTNHHPLAVSSARAPPPVHLSCLNSIHQPSRRWRIKKTRGFSTLHQSKVQNKAIDYVSLQEDVGQAEVELIDAISEELAYFEARVLETAGSESPLLEALMLVDLTERLGIQRYFEHHLHKILSATYKKWDEKRGLNDADATVLAFRLLRLHGYPVSADVIETLKEENGGFFASFSATTPAQVSALLNLYRCSQTSFPYESKIMNEAREFASSQLQSLLLEGDSTLLQTNGLRMEIEFATECPRRCLLPRLESRSIIRQLWPGDARTHKYLKLAKLDLNMLQKLHRQELEEVERWWLQQGFGAIESARRNEAKSFFSAAPGMFEPKFSTYRLAFTKTVCLLFIMDDLFDDKSYSLEELHRFNEALKRWDPSLIDDLPHYKLLLTSICILMPEMANEYYRLQGCDILPLLKDLWVSYTTTTLTEAGWTRNHHVPSFEEYLKAAHLSIGVCMTTCATIFSLGEKITPEIWSHIGLGSTFLYHSGLVARLTNDLVGFEKEAREEKAGTAVNCYIRDNPQVSREEAIAYIEGLVESSCLELELELYRSRGVVPECCSRALLNCARIACLAYKSEDGFTYSVQQHMQLLKDYLFGSLE